MPLNVGSRLGHPDAAALIGEGAMGQVYQATDTKLNRQGDADGRYPLTYCAAVPAVTFRSLKLKRRSTSSNGVLSTST